MAGFNEWSGASQEELFSLKVFHRIRFRQDPTELLFYLFMDKLLPVDNSVYFFLDIQNDTSKCESKQPSAVLRL